MYFLFYKVGEVSDDKQTKPQLNHAPRQDEGTLQQEEVTYATVSVKDKKVKQG